MQTLIDFERAPAFAIALTHPVGTTTVREGLLIEGPQGWGEFSPAVGMKGQADAAAVRWVTAAIEPGTVGWPDPVRGRVPVAVSVPAVDAELARRIVAGSPCRTASVEVGTGDLDEDVARVAAVRDAIGSDGVLRCDARGRWDAETARTAITALHDAAGGLEFIERPCATLSELRRLRKTVDVHIAAHATMRDAPPDAASAVDTQLRDAADVVVLACGPLGGARRALRVAEAVDMPCVVTSMLETSVGLAAGLAVAGALPDLPFACQLGTRPLLAGDLVVESRSLVPDADGCLPVAPMAPAPQPELLDRFAMTDPARLTWWRERLRAAVTAS
ncbi:O-succinylbenzoate synthase [Mycolicibacterium goodii]|uniref:enolase C-terminal domain-like protein n=1 Tax=Mycolicibacterium goodii TaxID=134601 RepID=UPI001BDC7FA7|nr:enolase C-terminal domain-like protein [Mycolicibacterium goodii]MBU8813235.1 O-succinylbenzoate synthase [Mycolicibacterium goodii]ULN45022.1 O-succinylbenzoate synthase [Mycolicibacterium goodii]